MIPFHLTVLGAPELHAPNGDPVRFRTRKHFALLIFLAIEPPVAHRRDKLASLLWGRADRAEARHSLATGLSLIRAAIGADALDTSRDAIRLLPGAITADIMLLDRDDASTANSTAIGPFLDDFDIDDAPDFQQWKDVQRAYLLPRLHRVLVDRITHSRRHGDSRLMETLAHQLHRVDDLSEDAARAQLEARAMAGDRIGALRAFDGWRSRLAEELGAIPSHALTRMADRLRRNGAARIPSASVAAVGTLHWLERIFVGRGAEFSACYDVWERVRAGECCHMLIRGDTGIGKTTLVERFATSVALEGASVARVKCHELERELPFGIIGGLVGQLLELPGASATPPEQLAEIGRLVTKVRQRYPGLPAPVPSTGETARMLFTEGVMALITAIADEHPVVLVVDDIHLADATSLAVLHLMLRRMEDVPLMAVLSSSSAVQVETPDARKFVESADSIALRQLHLGPLPADEAAELLDTLLVGGADPGPTLRRAILAGARGNPMVLELLVGDWRRRGADCLALSLGAMTSTAQTPPQDAFRQVVDHTLVDLDAESRSVAELGAILGQRLNDLSMYALVDLPVARTMRAMTSLAAQRILRDAGNDLEFTNDFVRGQCYVAMAAPLRRMLHGAVADRLLTQDGADEKIPGLEIAWHLVRADRLGEAVPYLLAGGREAIEHSAPHEADLALSTGLPALTGAARRTAILLLVEAQQELGRWGDSLQLLEIADEPFTESEHCCREVYRSVALRWLGRLSLAAMGEATQRLLRIANSTIAIDVRVRALTASIRLLGLTRDETQLSLLEKIIPAANACEMDSYQRLHVILSRAWILSVRHKTDEALEEIAVGVGIAREAQIRSSIAVRLLVGQGNLLSMAGRYDEALSPLSEAEEISARLDNPTLHAECASLLAMVEGRLGRHTVAIGWARKAISYFAPSECSACSIMAVYELGLGLLAEGQVEQARAEVRVLSTLAERDAPKWAVQAGLLFEADVIGLSGNPRRAFALARKATSGPLSDLHHIAYAGQYARWIALIGAHDDQPLKAWERLGSVFPELNRLDSKDQAELLAAQAFLASKIGLKDRGQRRALEQRLARLPPSVRTTMRRLGVYQDTTTAGEANSPPH